ncbi:hypothetical protein EPUS_02109 [Endocarpon pusillum Z07020]|uniref:NTF2 domain-containing protein n=1 Tax=Endocarpon pusillum (strain Z07020 / HMAS-L-300199) TaxID=1263415 RepID=U1G4I9_ENDPU|nr:uncharacterized protein EPUS_02109 [Endocarpon pusillum Z07020]ERF72222.1 hypothetical protein EPUS_02109 [Endocarpon pusillum Z07020]
MATDLPPSVNGLYGSQYGQPAELAASVPSSTPASVASQGPAESASNTAKADPQEIGWYFVEQYYTTLSKQPDRIHLFYSKKSQLVTGVEAEKVLPSVGQKAINEKIKELDIQDCKVRVLNVDSQTSLNNIVVQVIGVMSNKSAPSKKFVQTFVLTPQTNGYYVLNDIFRYLNDEEDEIIEDEPAQEPTQEPTQVEEASATPPPATDTEQGSVNSEAAIEQVDAKLEEVVESDAPQAVNGASTGSAMEEPVQQEAAPEVAEEANVPLPAENPPEPEHTPAVSPPKAATPAPAAEAPPSKKTWANLVGSKATAIPAVPVPTAVVPSQPKAQKSPPPPSVQPQQNSTTNEPGTSSGSQSNEWQTADHGKKQARPQNKTVSEGNVLGYIKNVTQKIEASRLRSVLEKYGEIKYFDNCAFVEFATPAGYNAAVAANPHQIGSEQIYVEERRPRPNAFGGSNSGFSRGGANVGRGRGGAAPPGRTGSQSGSFPKEAGRGTFQQRGGKTGSVTPKGRGQPQAS